MSARWTRRLARACLDHPVVSIASLAAATGATGLQVVGPLLIRQIVDLATTGRLDGRGDIVVALLGLALLRFGCGYLRGYLAARLSLDVQHDLRCAVVRALSRLDGPGHQRTRSGQVVSRVIADLQVVQALVSIVPLAVGSAVLLVCSLAAMLWLSPLLGSVSLISLPLVGLYAARYRSILFPTTSAMQHCVADITGHVAETVAGVRVVKAFAQEERETAAMAERALRLYRYRLRVARLTARLTPRVASLPSLSLVVVIVLGGWMTLRGYITLGTFVAFCAYGGSLIVPVRVVSRLVVSGQLARASVQRVHELIDARPTVTDPADPADLPDGPLAIEFDGVVLRRSDAEPVLRGFTLRVEPGETVAVVGSTGSGKSTAVLLLARFDDPDEGYIRIGASDRMVELPRLRLDTLRGALGVVFEETMLFSGSVRDNIAFGRPDATDDEVRAAARTARADTFVEELPDGYDTMVGERGLTLSGGQRQRVALARALLSEPRILLLDDATSAVDAATEAAVHAGLRATGAGRTTVLIAHRRSTLALADRVVVLNGGRVVDVGTVAELDARGALPDAGTATSVVPAPRRSPDRQLWPDEASPASAESAPPPDDRLLPIGPTATGSPPAPLSLGALLRPVRGAVALTVGLLGGAALIGVTFPSLARIVVDDGIVPGDAQVLVLVAGLGLALVAAEWLVTAVQVVVAARAGESVLYGLRLRGFAHLQRLGLDYYERESSGRIVTTLTSDVDSLSAFLQTGLAQGVIGLVTLTGVAIALSVTGGDLSLVVWAMLPVAVVATAVFRGRSGAAHRDARERAGAMSTDLLEKTSGLPVIQACCREAASVAAFAALSRSHRSARLRAQHCGAVYFTALQLLADLTLIVVLAVGGHRVAAGTLSTGVLVAFVLYLEMFFSPLQTLSQVMDGYQQAAIALARVGRLLGTVPSVPDPDPDDAVAARGPSATCAEVRFRHVRFRYPGADRDAVADVDLRIRPGETVALVGATGAGKSTLVKLLGRFYDATGGEVSIDGVDVRRYPASEHRRRLGLVPQEAHLFAGDVASNIAYGRPDASREEIESAAREIGATEVIAGLPHGFRQPVGERGTALSAGQRQLVALARAHLVNPRLLLLDEATAALDPATEGLVLAAAERLSSRRTTVVVAHRPTTAARADRIVVLADGRVAEQGGHEELLARDGRYAELWRIAERVAGDAHTSGKRTDGAVDGRRLA